MPCLALYWYAKLSPINGDMGVPFQARSRYFSRLAVLKLSWDNLFIRFLQAWHIPSRHARAILMCLTLLNSFNHMKSFTMFIFSWLKFVKKRGTSIYLWGYMSCLLLCVFIALSRFGTVCNDLFSTKLAELLGLTVPISLDDSTTAGGAWHFCVGRLLLLRSKSGPGGTLYHYGLCELAQRQAVLLRKDKLSNRAIKSDRAKVVMTAGCILRTGQR